MNNGIKYSFILTYIDRDWQFRNTLVSLNEHYRGRRDVEMSIVEDIKNIDDKQAHARFLEALKLLPSSLPVVLSVGGERDKIDPTPQGNQAVAQSSGKYICIMSQEILHQYNMLDEFDKIYKTDDR